MAGQNAIVIGASMSGLLAARALAEYYTQVTILERDIFPAHGHSRKGVPQDRHPHALLAKGKEIIEDFFPGITQELIDQGCISAEISQNSRWVADGKYFCRYDNGLRGLLVGRPLLEAQVRQRLLSLPNVQAIQQCQVLGLVTNTDNSCVTGVRYINLGEDNSELVLNADLVVDASGRNSKSSSWLESLGYEQPLEEKVKIDISYTTRVYRRQAGELQGDNFVVVGASLPNWRNGVISAQEGDRWIVSISGYLGDHAPTEEQGYLEFAKSIPVPDIYDFLQQAEPLSEFIPYKFPSSQRRYYEKLKRFPEGYLVFGDAICSFNPVYGQGMTVAALEAVALGKCLATKPKNLSQRFFAAISKLLYVPWNLAVGGDLRIPEVQGKRSLMLRFLNWYISKLYVAAEHDPKVVMAFIKVVNLMANPQSLMHPEMMLRILLGNLWVKPIAQLSPINVKLSEV
ncbi:2-polyprenyl-6-methoxyphenol hydroxylase-like oxidoreductase [Sphaerospermopsis aphanizomenoides BCCUSP55]|uniref:FAD-dependent oxidoreductase n=1 Tax=Sphaerospermopsis aphanizomenoides TaxID=459663 RepID=UPI001908E4D2|nr:2-polyprenyl-6-methoxyphenol hydroxylase-like oxidoreductase [Sphaerospermopsis aphanizomenoides]MBK1986063.1 2-polyprenyl-6-methoxyphenol hydroxylase-like oxidoreductase [Sphaerospermopsis aphanizomenoides BCCUSP55]